MTNKTIFKILLNPIIFLSIFLSCSSNPPTSIYCKLADKIMTQFANDVEIKNGLVLSGSGGEFFNQIGRIFLSFDTLGPKSEMELRILMIDIVEDFLDRINSDEDIRKFLANYPFKSNNLEFWISLRGKDLKTIKNKGCEKKLLYGVLLINGKIFYEIKNEDKPFLQDVYEETYEEALEIVNKRKALK